LLEIFLLHFCDALTKHTSTRTRSSIVGIATGYSLDNQGVGV
jgi:hypothetical protein